MQRRRDEQDEEDDEVELVTEEAKILEQLEPLKKQVEDLKRRAREFTAEREADLERLNAEVTAREKATTTMASHVERVRAMVVAEREKLGLGNDSKEKKKASASAVVSRVMKNLPTTWKEVRQEQLATAKRRLAQYTVINACPYALEVRYSPDKGRGVFLASSSMIRREHFICEYAGELIPLDVAEEREKRYEEEGDKGSYMFFFRYKGKQMCVDATDENPDWGMGRLINHTGRLTHDQRNIHPYLVEVAKEPHIVFLALREIKPGEELLYDYGDWKSDLEWLK